MAHNLESENGEVAFALRGKPAWHNLANRIFSQDEEVSTQLMLDEAKLSNWDVRLSPVTDHIPTEWNDSSGSQFVLSVITSENPQIKKGKNIECYL